MSRMKVNLEKVYLEPDDWTGVKSYCDATLRQQSNGKIILDIPDTDRLGVDAHFEVVVVKKETFEKLMKSEKAHKS